MELWFILKVKHTAFSDGLDVRCEKKRGNQEWQQGCSGLSNWNDGECHQLPYEGLCEEYIGGEGSVGHAMSKMFC